MIGPPAVLFVEQTLDSTQQGQARTNIAAVGGPASSTDHALARFDLTTGKLLQDSSGILSDAGILSLPDGFCLKGVTSTTTGVEIGVLGAGWLGFKASNVLFLYSDGSIIYNASLIVAQSGIKTGVGGVGGLAPVVGGSLFDQVANGASVSVDGTEDTLYTNTLVANGINNPGAALSGRYTISIVGHAISTDRIRLYFGGTAIYDTAAVNIPADATLTLDFVIVDVNGTTVRCSVTAHCTSATAIPLVTYTEITGLTLSDAQILALKSISTGTNAAAGDVTARFAKVIWHPAD